MSSKARKRVNKAMRERRTLNVVRTVRLGPVSILREHMDEARRMFPELFMDAKR